MNTDSKHATAYKFIKTLFGDNADPDCGEGSGYKTFSIAPSPGDNLDLTKICADVSRRYPGSILQQHGAILSVEIPMKYFTERSISSSPLGQLLINLLSMGVFTAILAAVAYQYFPEMR